MIRIEEILSSFQAYAPQQSDTSALRKAYVLAVKYLSQKSFLGPSRLDFALECAQELTKLKLDLSSIQAGLLYEVLLDSRMPPRELAGMIGEETVAIIEKVNEILMIGEHSRNPEQLAHLMRHLIVATSKELRVLFVLLVIRVVKLRGWSSFSRKSSIQLAKETFEIYAPMAERFGLAHLKAELEDMSFALLYPKESNEIREFCLRNQTRHQQLLKRFQTELEGIFQSNELPARVEGRIKHAYSLWAKSIRKGEDYAALHDIIGLRVIVPQEEEVMRILKLLTTRFHSSPQHEKNYIAFPKPNGYQAYHAMLIDEDGEGFEVQIRTEEMHQRAEIGVAAHWAYKVKTQEGDETDNLAWIHRLAQDLNITADPKESLELFTRELYTDFVYTYTPKAKVVRLPLGSTVLDFAYRVHSDLGNHCFGALVNGSNANLDHVLNHGDKVEILTSEKTQPTASWLDFVKTSRALKEIRQQINKQQKSEAKEQGREILYSCLRAMGKNPDTYLKSAEFIRFLEKYKVGDLTQYMTKLGFGSLRIADLEFYLFKEMDRGGSLREMFSLGYFKKNQNIWVEEGQGEPTHLAQCCNPVRGDEILAIRVRGKGIKIHRRDCPNLSKSMRGNQLIEARWEGAHNDPVQAHWTLVFENKIKTEIQLLKLLEGAKAQVQESHLKAVNGEFHLDMSFMVPNRDTLEKLKKRIGTLPGIKVMLRSEKKEWPPLRQKAKGSRGA